MFTKSTQKSIINTVRSPLKVDPASGTPLTLLTESPGKTPLHTSGFWIIPTTQGVTPDSPWIIDGYHRETLEVVTRIDETRDRVSKNTIKIKDATQWRYSKKNYDHSSGVSRSDVD